MPEPIYRSYRSYRPDELSRIFSDVYCEMTGKHICVSAKFYKYTGIKSTVRLKKNVLEIKVSDMLYDAPEKVLVGLAYILISKIAGKKCPKIEQKIYRLWINSTEMNLRHLQTRKERGHSVIHKPFGAVYNLEDTFEKLNHKYFDSVLSMPILYWGKNATVKKYGHYDPSKHAILISKVLDDEKIPQYVVEFVLYHEMLHIVHDVKQSDYQNRCHHREFREDEKKFERYEDAEKWLTKLSAMNSIKRKFIKKRSGRFGFW